MKRVRCNSTSAPIHECPYAGCNKHFRSEDLFAAHVRAHSAALPFACNELRCPRRFAVASALEFHVRENHTNHQTPPVTCGLEKGSNILSDSTVDEAKTGTDGRTISEYGVANSDDIRRRKKLEEDANEIVENAGYLASQMKVARSYEIANWNSEDYRNAHQWAVWVQESIEDFPDVPVLERKLEENGLSVTALQSAERAFFDSVLGFEGLNEDILRNMLDSVAPFVENGVMKEGSDERLERLCEALVAAVDRKRALGAVAQLALEVDDLVGCEHRDQSLPAKAELLLSRHKRLDTSRVRKHLAGLSITDIEAFEIICYETVMAYDERAECCKVLLEHCRRAITSVIAEKADAHVLEEVCERDVQFFDSYLSLLLLGYCEEGKTRAETTAKLEGLARRKGPVGYITRSAIEECSRTRGA